MTHTLLLRQGFLKSDNKNVDEIYRTTRESNTVDITQAFKLHTAHFGIDETIKIIKEIDRQFVSKQVNGLKGRRHDKREMLKSKNTWMISRIGHSSECSDRIFRRSGMNSLTWFFPLGFTAALAGELVSGLRNALREVSPEIRDNVFAIDLGL